PAVPSGQIKKSTGTSFLCAHISLYIHVDSEADLNHHPFEWSFCLNITISQELTQQAFLDNNCKGEPLPLLFFGLSFRSPMFFTFGPRRQHIQTGFNHRSRAVPFVRHARKAL
ncbi:MAG: hypothetical protein OIF58_13900, partial [Cohaesibacter sp.]|nr:hypothetical protein [Cohaesibacter sp.]